MSVDRAFALRVALFNAVGFAVYSGTTTFADSRLSTHPVWGARHYPCGYWICAFAPLVFVAMYFILTRFRSPWTIIVLAGAAPLLVSVAALPNFLPELPHMGILGSGFLYGLFTLFAVYARVLPIQSDYVKDPHIDTTFKIERVKQAVRLWHTVATGAFLGFVAILVPWYLIAWTLPEKMVAKREEAYVLSQVITVGISTQMVYVLCGPVYELFKRAERAADLLLHIEGTVPGNQAS